MLKDSGKEDTRIFYMAKVIKCVCEVRDNQSIEFQK